MRQFTCSKAVTHPSTNWARCRATALIETNALPVWHVCMLSLQYAVLIAQRHVWLVHVATYSHWDGSMQAWGEGRHWSLLVSIAGLDLAVGWVTQCTVFETAPGNVEHGIPKVALNALTLLVGGASGPYKMFHLSSEFCGWPTWCWMVAGKWTGKTEEHSNSSKGSPIYPSVGYRYFPPGPRLSLQPPRITTHWPVPNYTA